MKKINEKTRLTVLTGILFAAAIVLSMLESAVAPVMGLPPGIKLGLANVVVMFAALFVNTPSAASLVVLKALFAMLTRGAAAGMLSLSGGVLSLVIIVILMKIKHVSLFIISVSGAIAHNLGQLAAISFIFTQSSFTLYYAPILIISGLAMGAATAFILQRLMPIFEKLKINRNNYQ